VKKFVITIAILVLIVAAIAVYLFVTTPSSSRGVQFPLAGDQLALVRSVPATADSFALIPTVAAVQAKLLANPATREVVQRWTEKHDLPQPWILGSADVLAFRTGKETTYLVRLDPVRNVIARLYLMVAGEPNARIVLDTPRESPIAAADLDPLLALTNGLPAGDALLVQREGSRGAFPPIGRPAVSSVRISPEAIDVVSHAAPSPDEIASPAPLRVRYARSAILTAAFAAPPRVIEDMNRLIGAKASALLGDGGVIALYDIETSKLLPRPREVIILPDTPERRAALDDFVRNAIPIGVREVAGIHIETGNAPGELLLSFDKTSIAQYLKDGFDPPALSGTGWSLRMDPSRAAPVLEQISDNPALRYLVPRIFRSAKDMRDWVGSLQNARSIEAAFSPGELRVRIATK